MQDIEGDVFLCPTCGNNFPWRAEAAGRPVTCGCGTKMLVPFNPGTAESRGQAAPASGLRATDDADDADDAETAPPRRARVTRESESFRAGEAESSRGGTTFGVGETGFQADSQNDADVGRHAAARHATEVEVNATDADAATRTATLSDTICPDCGAAMRPGAIVCTNCGYHRPRPKKRVFTRRRTAAVVVVESEQLDDETAERELDSDAEAEASEEATDDGRARVRARRTAARFQSLAIRPGRDVILPIALALAGLIAEVGLLAQAFRDTDSFARALAFAPLLVLLAIGTVAVVFIIGLLLTPVLDLSWGPVGPLVVKLGAAVIFPAAVGALIYGVFPSRATGVVVGWMASVVLYLALFRVLFEFEWPDALLLIAIVCLAQAIVVFTVIWPLTHGPMSVVELRHLFTPIVLQSAITFLFAGGVIAPHFRAI